MEYLFKVQNKIVPEVLELAETRFAIMSKVNETGAIGRRALAEKLNMSERQVRNELEFLSDNGFLEITRAGAQLSTRGESFLKEFERYIRELKNFSRLETEISQQLGLEDVIIVPCDFQHTSLLRELGRSAARYVLGILQPGDILAITGGYTMAEVANMMSCKESLSGQIEVVPGRGGLGEVVEIQANTIAAQIANKIGADYHLLQVPDNLREENIAAIKQEPSIQKTLEVLHNSNILVHGIGEAAEMASRRGRSEKEINDLLDKGAVGESFGFYFDAEGNIVHSTPSIGVGLEDVTRIERVIAVAGGEDKARAIPAVVSPEYQDVLITDEETASSMLEFLRGSGNSSK